MFCVLFSFYFTHLMMLFLDLLVLVLKGKMCNGKKQRKVCENSLEQKIIISLLIRCEKMWAVKSKKYGPNQFIYLSSVKKNHILSYTFFSVEYNIVTRSLSILTFASFLTFLMLKELWFSKFYIKIVNWDCLAKVVFWWAFQGRCINSLKLQPEWCIFTLMRCSPFCLKTPILKTHLVVAA